MTEIVGRRPAPGHAPATTPISPELALVSPELAERARELLPEHPWEAFLPEPSEPQLRSITPERSAAPEPQREQLPDPVAAPSPVAEAVSEATLPRHAPSTSPPQTSTLRSRTSSSGAGSEAIRYARAVEAQAPSRDVQVAPAPPQDRPGPQPAPRAEDPREDSARAPAATVAPPRPPALAVELEHGPRAPRRGPARTHEAKPRRGRRILVTPAVVALAFAAMIWASARTPEPKVVASEPVVGGVRGAAKDPADAASTAGARHFGWARKPGASAYRVELLRGPARVFVTRTAGSQITLPTTWRFAGRSHRLTRGDYVVYVWALVPGHADEMIVQAKLAVPDR